MGTNPTVMTRLRAAFKGEVAASDLEAYKTAGLSVYELLSTIDQRRKEMLLSGTNPWDVEQSTQTQLFAGWVAYALQTLGDDFVEADYAADAGTVGYVPPVTLEQSMNFYAEVGDWVSVSREAAVNPAYRQGVTRLVSLPEWVEVEPCPIAHLQAMVKAATKLGERAEALMVDVRAARLDDKQHQQLKRVEQLLVRGNTYRERAERLWGTLDIVSEELHEQVEGNVKEAIQVFFDAGQLLAMPSLIGHYDNPRVGATQDKVPSLASPGERDFDMWCLTDPATRRQWQRDRAAVRAIEALWQYDPNPAKTLRIQSEIDTAERRGDIVRSGDGNFFCCPWSAIYRAVNPIKIGGERIRRGDTFTFDVSAEEIAEGGSFKREILVANFSPTSTVDYCNPDEGGHDD